MDIKELNYTHSTSAYKKLTNIYSQFGELLIELRKRDLPQNIEHLINSSVDEINSSTLTENQLTKLIKQKQTAILKQLEKEHKIVPKNYYRNMWMLLGFTAIGLPIGVAFGVSLKNLGLLGLGLPIGLAIGSVIGSSMDKKALHEGRQLPIEIKI